jgi:hypothetical protein
MQYMWVVAYRSNLAQVVVVGAAAATGATGAGGDAASLSLLEMLLDSEYDMEPDEEEEEEEEEEDEGAAPTGLVVALDDTAGESVEWQRRQVDHSPH